MSNWRTTFGNKRELLDTDNLTGDAPPLLDATSYTYSVHSVGGVALEGTEDAKRKLEDE
jgi:hypothetical protein